MIKDTIRIRPLQESDLPTADHILRLAFGTFVGLADPMTFFGDTDPVRTRFLANPSGALAAEINNNNGEIVVVGSNFVANWGSVGFFGPLSIRPDLWDRGIAKLLVESTINLFDKWGTKHMGLFTFSHSPKHIGLYQKFDFWPRFLTAIMSKPVVSSSSTVAAAAATAGEETTIRTKTEGRRGHENGFYLSKYSELSSSSLKEKSQEEKCLNACRALTDTIYEGLDLSQEITAVKAQKLGDTLLLWDKGEHDGDGDDNNISELRSITKGSSRLLGLAVCHYGAGTEAGSNTCYVKVGAVGANNNNNNDGAGKTFGWLLNACEELAREKGMSRLVAGVNTARHKAYRKMIEHGFRTDIQGIVMQRYNEPGYNRPDVYFIDDWR
jgi:GNAT superfamily N-acetyltransferase